MARRGRGPGRGLVAVCLALALGVGAWGDEIVLKSGRTFVGVIVEEGERAVVIESRGGRMTFERALIREIRRGPVPEGAGRAPAPPARQPSDGKANNNGSDNGNEKGNDKARDGGRRPGGPRATTPRDLLAELEAIPLAPWEQAMSERVQEPDHLDYKLVLPGGRVQWKKERPASPDGIAELWMCVPNSDGMHLFFEDGRPQLLWRRLWWHADRGEWRFIHPSEAAFQQDCALVRRILDGITSKIDENARIGCAVLVQTIRDGRTGHEKRPVDDELARLRTEAAKAAGSAAAGALLYRIFEIEIALGPAAPSEKVRLAEQRRGLVREFVNLTAR